MDTVAWVQTVVLLVTAVTLYFYTAETAALRRETVRQTKVALRPVVVPIFERKTGTSWIIRLENIGSGSAFNIKIKPHIKDPGALDIEYRFGSIDYLSPQSKAFMWYGQFIEGKPYEGEMTKYSFFPLFATVEQNLLILFDDVEGQTYSLPVTIIPSAHPGFILGPFFAGRSAANKCQVS